MEVKLLVNRTAIRGNETGIIHAETIIRIVWADTDTDRMIGYYGGWMLTVDRDHVEAI